MRELESAQQEHLGQIPETQFIEQPAEYDLEDNVSRELKEVERSAGSLVKLASAAATPETV